MRRLGLAVIAIIVTACAGSTTTPTASVAALSSAAVTASAADVPSAPAAATATAAGSACTGSSSDTATIAQWAAGAGFDVYCAVLPAGWTILSIEHLSADQIDVNYRGPAAGEAVDLVEGMTWCETPDPCLGGTTKPSKIASASLATLPGGIYSPGVGVYVLYALGGKAAYEMESAGATVEQLTSWASALVKVGPAA